MADYCVRVRVRLGDRVRIASGEQEIAIGVESDKAVVLQSSPASLPLSEAQHVALIVKPYESETEAAEAAAHWRAILPRAFARINIGADFGDRAATGAATAQGLAALEVEQGARVLNDVHGPMVFECAPWPKFVRIEASGTVGKPPDRLQAVVHTAALRNLAMSEREMLAYQLFSASFSAESADARFVLLMMALETLIEPEPRARSVVEHVDLLIATTENSDLPRNEVASIAGSLRWLRSESVGQAGRRLAERLGGRRYMDEAPQIFFSRCYERSSPGF